ncbi:helix-turn-helix transcriptional regulator [Nocardia sp. NPDC023733]|uniref:helix-turn-helix domain-containing protein n=2 Tax=unclassified Nocardia TaxID=2637762 RepID=UPI0033EEABF2
MGSRTKCGAPTRMRAVPTNWPKQCALGASNWGLTQTEVARRAGIPQPSLSRIEVAAVHQRSQC